MIFRRKMAAANWKMNLTVAEGIALVNSIQEGIPNPLECDVVIAPPYTHISSIMDQVGNSGIQIAAQNCFTEPNGAYTGEISIAMLKSLGVDYIITGHSERRQLFDETNAIVRRKVELILESEIKPIFCCGESLQIRNEGKHMDFVQEQLEECVFHLPGEAISKVVIAYEPIWAIGTGVTATPEQAQEMHAFIRQAIVRQYGHEIGDHIRILYGGSIKADNARMLFSQRDVDGGLVGGASLDAAGFLAIIAAAGSV